MEGSDDFVRKQTAESEEERIVGAVQCGKDEEKIDVVYEEQAAISHMSHGNSRNARLISRPLAAAVAAGRAQVATVGMLRPRKLEAIISREGIRGGGGGTAIQASGHGQSSFGTIIDSLSLSPVPTPHPFPSLSLSRLYPLLVRSS